MSSRNRSGSSEPGLMRGSAGASKLPAPLLSDSLDMPLHHFNALIHSVLLAALAAWLLVTRGWTEEARLLPWLLFAYALLGLLERMQPHRDEWTPGTVELKRDAQALGLNLLTDTAVGAVLTLALTSLARPALDLPLGIQLLIALPLAEFGPYWLHRLSHRGGWLWRAHVLHHRPDKLNVANALTSHPLNAAWDKLARLAPLLLLGFSAEVMLAISAFALTQGLWVHANVAAPPRSCLSLLIGTPELHRLHHSSAPEQAGNYGTTLPLWDHVFRTYRRGDVGAVGVYEPAAYPEATDFGALLSLPFSRRMQPDPRASDRG
jgi:sterol desaturase/sphingolipid hydroxylase (fatty acid hydroxylase superfamily)